MTQTTTLQPAEAGTPLTSTQLVARLAVIQDVMKHVMKDGQDYGTIPGTPKPTLYKPGAEKLCVTFRLSAGTPLIEAVPEYSGDIRYRVQVPIVASDGAVLAVGVGECSTGEEKYRWRRPVHPNEYAAAPEDQKRQKFTRDGDVWDQVRVHPADVANTVLKMAHKRAYVHAVIMATAAGAIFTQDVEDMPDGMDGNGQPGATKPPVQPPQRKSQQPGAGHAPVGAGSTVRVKVTDVDAKAGTGQNGKAYTKFTISASDGKRYGTFSDSHQKIAREALAGALEVDLTFTESKYGRDIQAIALVEREPGADDQ